MSDEGTPILPHFAGEFTTWLWWASETRDGVFDLGGEVGRVEVWVDERLAFRSPDETKVLAVMTGESPSTTLEARAALAGGKVLHELRIGIRREDREFRVSLRGPELHFARTAVPQVVGGEDSEAIRDRMFLYEETALVIQGLLTEFAQVRTSAAWAEEVRPQLAAWVAGR